MAALEVYMKAATTNSHLIFQVIILILHLLFALSLLVFILSASPTFHVALVITICCSVDTFGNICLDILKEKWSAALSVSTLLLSLQGLLCDPNNSSPLNEKAAAMWVDQACKYFI
jgi:hypothetical protein